jgi:hypothetical protein
MRAQRIRDRRRFLDDAAPHEHGAEVASEARTGVDQADPPTPLAEVSSDEQRHQ